MDHSARIAWWGRHKPNYTHIPNVTALVGTKHRNEASRHPKLAAFGGVWWYFGSLRTRAGRGSPRVMKPQRSPRYLAWIRTQPCGVCGSTRRIEASHTGPHGIGQKSPDTSAIPLCAKHHRTGPESYHRLGPKKFSRRTTWTSRRSSVV